MEVEGDVEVELEGVLEGEVEVVPAGVVDVEVDVLVPLDVADPVAGGCVSFVTFEFACVD